jgi:hypothetical protein
MPKVSGNSLFGKKKNVRGSYKAKAKKEKYAEEHGLLQTYHCICCDADYKSLEQNFFNSQSSIFSGFYGRIPICKRCINNLYNKYLGEYNGNEQRATERMCMILNLYWSTSLFNCSARDSAKRTRIESYIARSNLVQYSGKTFDNTLNEINEDIIKVMRDDLTANIKIDPAAIVVPEPAHVESDEERIKREEYQKKQNEINLEKQNIEKMRLEIIKQKQEMEKEELELAKQRKQEELELEEKRKQEEIELEQKKKQEELEKEKEQEQSNDVEPVKEEKTKEEKDYDSIPDPIKQKWGVGLFTAHEYRALESHYDMLERQNPECNSNQEIFIRDLCMIKLQQLEAIRNKDNDGFEKFTKLYQDTFKKAELKTAHENDKVENECLGVMLSDICNFTPEEYYRDKKRYTDADGYDEYFEKHIVRPLKNIVLGTNERDPENTVGETNETEKV